MQNAAVATPATSAGDGDRNTRIAAQLIGFSVRAAESTDATARVEARNGLVPNLAHLKVGRRKLHAGAGLDSTSVVGPGLSDIRALHDDPVGTPRAGGGRG